MHKYLTLIIRTEFGLQVLCRENEEFAYEKNP